MIQDSNWEDQLPSPHELVSLSQSLITPDLATAFDIHFPAKNAASISPHHHYHQQTSSFTLVAPLQPNSSEFDSSSAELGGGGGGGVSSSGGGDDSARTLKRPRLVWTPQLHKRFVDAVAHLGIKNAVPKTIMQLMSVDGLTRENVASHLQKYRLYLKRMQGLHNGGGPVGVGGSVDPATDRLFASSPVPPHLLLQGGGPGDRVGGNGGPNSEQCMASYMALNHHQMAAAVAGHQRIQAQYQQQMGMGLFGPGQDGGQLYHPFLSRQAQLGPHRNGIMVQNNSGYVDDLGSATVNNGNARK